MVSNHQVGMLSWTGALHSNFNHTPIYKLYIYIWIHVEIDWETYSIVVLKYVVCRLLSQAVLRTGLNVLAGLWSINLGSPRMHLWRGPGCSGPRAPTVNGAGRTWPITCTPTPSCSRIKSFMVPCRRQSRQTQLQKKVGPEGLKPLLPALLLVVRNLQKPDPNRHPNQNGCRSYSSASSKHP